MDDDARQAAVTALVRLAGSPHYQDRADAGRSLASFADVPLARQTLLELVLDTADTFVIQETTEALLRRGSAEGLAIVCVGAATAEGEDADHLYGALYSTLGVFERDRDAAVATCHDLMNDPAQDHQTRDGAAALIAKLSGFRPALLASETA
ncbi:hypothetical protein SAMN04488564_103428 [Lentzea waywayandensis]|uniref:HEAT repeat-containing protein n=1 Tax=Lentzea waywayandensis TaxID=84724 RepID=A0A1I6DYH0_9PSEU|nr:hypothetical protein [Lentzea waywayandensis]SFR10580.1 hypothetical protein SAMN04488564_103428 [Lentzea waywayandensis]